jgi:hypothetical protein
MGEIYCVSDDSNPACGLASDSEALATDQAPASANQLPLSSNPRTQAPSLLSHSKGSIMSWFGGKRAATEALDQTRKRRAIEVAHQTAMEQLPEEDVAPDQTAPDQTFIEHIRGREVALQPKMRSRSYECSRTMVQPDWLIDPKAGTIDKKPTKWVSLRLLLAIVTSVCCRYPWLYVHRLGERGKEIMFCIWCWKDKRRNSFASGCVSIRKALILSHSDCQGHISAVASRSSADVFHVVEVHSAQNQLHILL